MDLNGAFDPLSSPPPMGRRDADEDVFEPLPPPYASEPVDRRGIGTPLAG